MNPLAWATLILEAGKLVAGAIARKAVSPITKMRWRKAENAAWAEQARAEAARVVAEKAGKT